MAPVDEGTQTMDSFTSTDHHCSVSYMTPWATVLAMTTLYLLALMYFCRYGKRMCLPVPDAIYPYKKRMKELKRALAHLLVDDVYIELTDDKLGQGAVGFVFKGYVYPRTQTRFKHKVPAAVKMSYPLPQKSIGLLEEAARMAVLTHPNIVMLIAVSKLSFSAFRPMIVMEWLPGGSLVEFFRDEIRRRDDSSRSSVRVRHIIEILTQVARALKYIHEARDTQGRELTHGDVAARNVLLTSRDLSSCSAKLGDFGLPLHFGPRLPVPWLPPEIVCALDRQPTHRPESDVWMFGVLAWECATLGGEPHYQRTIEEIQRVFRQPDRGLPCPTQCPSLFYGFVLDCLAEQHRRPRFAGPADTNASVLYRLQQLRDAFSTSDHCFEMVANVSNCTCAQHRCRQPLPSFKPLDQ